MAQGARAVTSIVGVILLGVATSLLSTGYLGCKKDEPPPPLPSASAVAAAPVPQFEPDPDDSAAAVASTVPSAHVKGSGAPAQSFAKCCFALTQNAVSAPEPTKTTFTSAASLCNSLVAAGKSGPSVVSTIQGLLRGASMPAACL